MSRFHASLHYLCITICAVGLFATAKLMALKPWTIENLDGKLAQHFESRSGSQQIVLTEVETSEKFPAENIDAAPKGSTEIGTDTESEEAGVESEIVSAPRPIQVVAIQEDETFSPMASRGEPQTLTPVAEKLTPSHELVMPAPAHASAGTIAVTSAADSAPEQIAIPAPAAPEKTLIAQTAFRPKSGPKTAEGNALPLPSTKPNEQTQTQTPNIETKPAGKNTKEIHVTEKSPGPVTRKKTEPAISLASMLKVDLEAVGE